MAPLYVLVALLGFGLLAFGSRPSLTAPVLGFVAVAAGLLLGGLADLGAAGSSRARGVLRLTGFVLGVLGLLTVVLSTALWGN